MKTLTKLSILAAFSALLAVEAPAQYDLQAEGNPDTGLVRIFNGHGQQIIMYRPAPARTTVGVYAGEYDYQGAGVSGPSQQPYLVQREDEHGRPNFMYVPGYSHGMTPYNR